METSGINYSYYRIIASQTHCEGQPKSGKPEQMIVLRIEGDTYDALNRYRALGGVQRSRIPVEIKEMSIEELRGLGGKLGVNLENSDCTRVHDIRLIDILVN